MSRSTVSYLTPIFKEQLVYLSFKNRTKQNRVLHKEKLLILLLCISTLIVSYPRTATAEGLCMFIGQEKSFWAGNLILNPVVSFRLIVGLIMEQASRMTPHERKSEPLRRKPAIRVRHTPYQNFRLSRRLGHYRRPVSAMLGSTPSRVNDKPLQCPRENCRALRVLNISDRSQRPRIRLEHHTTTQSLGRPISLASYNLSSFRSDCQI